MPREFIHIETNARGTFPNGRKSMTNDQVGFASTGLYKANNKLYIHIIKVHRAGEKRDADTQVTFVMKSVNFQLLATTRITATTPVSFS